MSELIKDSAEAGLSQVLGNTLSQWAAAKDSRFRRERELPYGGAGADYHFQNPAEFYKIVEYARSMERDDVIIGPSLAKSAYLTVGDGPTFKPASGNDKYDLAWWEAWDQYSNNPDACDMSRENTWGEMVRLVARSMLRDGDIMPLAVGVGEGKKQNVSLQMFEAHQVRSPNSLSARDNNIVLGVQLDERRVRKYYHVTGDDPAPEALYKEENLRRVSTFRQIPGMGEFRQLFHTYHPRRVSESRGVSALAPAFDTAGMFEDINFAKLVQSVIISCIGFIRQTADVTGMPGETVVSPLANSQVIGNVDGTNILESIQPGFLWSTRPGEKIEGFSPKVPNAEFFEQARLAITLIGINIGLPLIILLMDASETNFSGWRGAFDQAKEGFKENQSAIKRRFCTPFMRLWTAVQIASGRLKVPKSLKSGDEFKHDWGFRRWPFIQPVQDAMDAILRQRNLLASPRSVHGEMGQDFETVVDQTTEDNAYAISSGVRKAAELNKLIKSEGDEDQPKITWRDVLSLPTYDKVNASFSDTADQPNANKVPAPTKTPPAAGAPE